MSDEPEQKTALRCIICGKSLILAEAVRYSGALAHATCTQKTIVERVGSFKRGLLYFGSSGVVVVVAIFLALSIGVTGPVYYTVAFAGIAVGLLLQSVGFVGIARNYDLPQGFGCTVLAILNALAYAIASFIVLVNGTNPEFYNEDGFLDIFLIPYMAPTLVSAYLLTGLLMVIFAVIVLILEDQLNPLYPNYIIAIILIVSAAFATGYPVNTIIEFILVTFVFLIAGPPPAWSEVSELH
ncbi:MAG: hypothetical protein ACTSUB_10625, partial [Candidatus Thorarchaeota archaeon]